MSKHVQAYFHNESEAEHVRVLLQTYPIQHVEIGAIQEAPDRNFLLLPLGATVGSGDVAVGATGAAYGAGGGAGSQAGAAAAFVGLNEAERMGHDDNRDGVDDRELQYVLSAQVQAADYMQIVELIRSNGGAVLQVDETP
ncbi:hypothetical protein SAMN02799630_05643 [Paenibacillus sp. UNCCL117]|uniref:hypothetical protein n=1 Tax=unclassified Paenibacillus TaxID=185978 RepID=UPI000884A81E|nr:MULTISPECIES: hypothetical protein [unclassified Paenibacillus]SDD62057.1 hypothetical protein SAMN04488602_11116 [Paenibacillus sp. cl123]SFW67598.1 hypothetical protein SAMN02799630_05643 [Paenibacillus sp. UNCCL117]